MERRDTAVERALDLALQVPAALAVLALMLHVSASALLRTYASRPLAGTLEYTQYWYLPLIAFIGIVVAQRRGEHIEARLLFDRFPRWAQRAVDQGSRLLFAALGVTFAYFSWGSAMAAASVGRSAVTGVPIWPVAFVVPIAFTLLALQLLVDAWRALRDEVTAPEVDRIGGAA